MPSGSFRRSTRYGVIAWLPFISTQGYRKLVARYDIDNRAIYVPWIHNRSTMSLRPVYDEKSLAIVVVYRKAVMGKLL